MAPLNKKCKNKFKCLLWRKGKIMSSTSYEGMVGMKPELEKRHFFSGDDDFTYQMPQVFFECQGDVDHADSAFDWRKESVITFKDNRAVRYTEFDHYELLMTDIDGCTEWVDGQLVDVMAYDMQYASDVRTVKSYLIEEFDWNKSEKRTYKVILESTSKLEESDEEYLKSVIDRDSKCIDEEYVLTDPDK